MKRLLDAYGGAGELVRDLHAYGGLTLASIGAALWTGEPGAGLVMGGAGLFGLLFVQQMRRQGSSR